MDNEVDGNNYNILLVEDNGLNQKVVIYSLKRYGFKIDIANNGIEAVEMFEEGKYNFILMDIMMPEMDGMQATRKIRSIELSQRIPIIAITADSILSTRDICMACGMDGHMTKPFNVKNLFHILNELDLNLKVV